VKRALPVIMQAQIKPEGGAALGNPLSNKPATVNRGGPLVRSAPLSEAELQKKIVD